jgi:hypothetical protein
VKHLGFILIALAILVVGFLGRWPGRYQMQPFDGDRFLRLDTVTGRFEICSLKTGLLRNADTILCGPPGGETP